MRFRLSLLMFLQYAAPGAWVPLLTVYLHDRGFAPLQVGWVCACSALAALVAPLAAGQVADRWVSSERCIGLCSLAAGLLLWLLPELTGPAAVFACSLAFWLVMTPVLTLGISVSFAHLRAPQRHYGRVRLWGTVGWVAPNLALGWWLAGPPLVQPLLAGLRPGQPCGLLADAFRLGGLAALALALYSLTLPHTPPARRGPSWLAPLAALHLLREPSFAVYALCAVGTCATLTFGQQVTPLLLEDRGVPRPWLSLTLTLSQAVEVAGLGLLPLLLRRLGVRRTMLLGLSAWAAALGILTLGRPAWLVVGSLGLYGLCIACFLVAGQVFVNGRAGRDIRASAQGLLTFLNGLGLLAGNVLVGWVREQVGDDFRLTFLTAAAAAGPLLVVFWAGFGRRGVAPAAADVVAPEAA
jgi:nucleoside transporter